VLSIFCVNTLQLKTSHISWVMDITKFQNSTSDFQPHSSSFANRKSRMAYQMVRHLIGHTWFPICLPFWLCILHNFWDIIDYFQKFKEVTWPWPRPFRNSMSSVGWDLLWSIYIWNLKSLCSPTTNIRKATQNVEIEVVWGLGVMGSPAMSPFDRAHTTSFLTLIETMHLSCTVFELQRVICRKSPIVTYPTCIWHTC